MEALGIAEMECSVIFDNDQNAIDRAITLFTAAVRANPNEGYAKYLYLGQYTCGMAAVEYIEKAIAILERENTETNQKKIAQTLCALIEIYMTDCW